MARKSRGRLYRGKGTQKRQRAAFTRRYGARGAEVYGKVVGKVKREQVALREPGAATEHVRAFWVPAHFTHRNGKRVRVKGHMVHAHLTHLRVHPRTGYIQLTQPRTGRHY